MRVLFFVHVFFPEHFYGTETYTLQLARHYRALGVDAHVVTTIPRGEPGAGELVTRASYDGVPVIRIDKNRLPNIDWMRGSFHHAEMRPVLERILREMRPDLVHVTHLINHTTALLEVSAELGIPAYATFTDFYPICFNGKLEAAGGGLCEGPAPNRHNCIACCLREIARHPQAGALRRLCTPTAVGWTAAAAARLSRLPPWRGKRLDRLFEDIRRRPEVMKTRCAAYRCAVAPTRFLSSAYKRNGYVMPLREITFGVDIDRNMKSARPGNHVPVMGFVGQLAPHKGPDILIEAFRRLPNGKARLRLYGSPNAPAYLERLRSREHGADIDFMGTFAPERMRAILDEIDLLVIPSRWYENSPLVLLNALASHTPVVVADVAGMTEFLEPGVNGWAFERGNADDLERVLRGILAQDGVLHEMSKQTHYERTSAIMAAETLTIYE